MSDEHTWVLNFLTAPTLALARRVEVWLPDERGALTRRIGKCERFGGLSAAIIEGAANVLYGARLVSRPGAFRHRDAWASQSVALSYAMEAYIRGLRGNSEGFAQAQLVVLTRLVRAVAAIATIDLLRTALPSNGFPKR